MPENEVTFGTANYAVLSDGKPHEVGEVSGSSLAVTSDSETPFLGDLSDTFTGTLELKLMGKTSDELLGDVLRRADRRVSLMFECVRRVPRHRYIWQYKAERKGNRKVVHGRTAKVRVVMPNAVVA